MDFKEQPIEPPTPKEDEEENFDRTQLKVWQLERAIIWAVWLIQEVDSNYTYEEIFAELGIDDYDFRSMVERDEKRRAKLQFEKLKKLQEEKGEK